MRLKKAITVSDRFRRGPCNKVRPELAVNCRLIFSRLASVSSVLYKIPKTIKWTISSFHWCKLQWLIIKSIIYPADSCYTTQDQVEKQKNEAKKERTRTAGAPFDAIDDIDWARERSLEVFPFCKLMLCLLDFGTGRYRFRLVVFYVGTFYVL